MPTYNYVKCSFVYNILWIKFRRLQVVYTVFYCTLWTNCVPCPLSLLQNIYCCIFLIVYRLCAFISHTAQNEYRVGKLCPFIHRFQLHSKWEECVVIWYGVLHTKLFRKFGLVDIVVAYVVQTVLKSCKLRNCDRNTDFTINWFCISYARNLKSHVKMYPEILESSGRWMFRVKWEN